MKVLISMLILVATGLVPHNILMANGAILRCNSATRQKRFVVRSSSNLSGDACSYTIKPYSSNVCQILMEFEEFELQPPTLNSNSNTLECQDHLSVGEYNLCGNNTGQHLYFPFHVSANGVKQFTMTFHLPKRWPGNLWVIKVSQLECPMAKKRNPFLLPFFNENMRTFFGSSDGSNEDVDSLAPSGCDQYFTPSSGSIKSFNFNRMETGAYYLPNMNYVICVKTPPEATKIEYHINFFSMSNEVSGSIGFDDECRSSVQTSGRREDYLMIPQSNVADNVNIQPTYYCGTSLQKHPAVLALPPFIMYFSSDSISDGSERGFHLNYNVRNSF